MIQTHPGTRQSPVQKKICTNARPFIFSTRRVPPFLEPSPAPPVSAFLELLPEPSWRPFAPATRNYRSRPSGVVVLGSLLPDWAAMIAPYPHTRSEVRYRSRSGAQLPRIQAD